MSSRPHAGQRLREAAYVHPGQLFVSREPHEVTTILGSCVAVCLYDEVLRAGGVNHYLLPEGAQGDTVSTRFATGAMAGLVSRMLALGSSRAHLTAKIFGGACVLEAFRGRRSDDQLGERNATMARRILERYQIAIAAEGVGGARGRKLIFHTDDGAAFVKEL